jgi:hypothetical protein
MFANYRELSRRMWSLPALLALAAVLAAGAGSNAAAQTTQQKAAARRAAQSPFNLGASANLHIAANLVECGMASTGKVCTDVFQSPTGGGGFWPTGSNNQYIFNSGVQLAGINHSDAGPWANDTVGAYFFDARGDQEQGAPLTQIFSSLDPNDLANWPQGAFANDTALFNAALIGSKSVSDQDSWVQYWDGDPNKLGHRTHPMGIKVEQRTMAFNAPAGAENILFLIYKMTNATNDPTFISSNNAKFGISLPAAGFTIDSVYADLGMDPDVSPAQAGDNFSTAILPFNLGMAWESHFAASDMSPVSHSSFYAAPFIAPPGFVGVKYLRSPVNPATGKQLGLTLFTNFTNGLPGFPDPVGPKQLWRYMSGNVSTAAGDQPCNVPNVKQSRLCFINSSPADTRFLEASGPFSLKPGQSVTIVVAYVFAAAVGANGYTPGTLVPPGIANATPGANGQPISQAEQMAGWVSTPANAMRADGTIDETKVKVVPHSLLFNAEVAQTIFNNKFLLPRPPVSPNFALVPGNNQVTVVWTPSVSETQGNPYFKIASDSASPLYNPNFRSIDIQGYRILRTVGVSGAPQVVADFSKKGTVFFDYTGEFDPNYVPETMGSYEDFANNNYGVYPVPVPLSGAVVEFPAGGRIQDAATGSVVIVKADTITLAAAGVPFAFVDKGVTNGLLYRYAVQAYSVNSLASGAITLSSPATTQNVVPRETNITAGSFTLAVQGSDGSALNTAASPPTIDPDKGIFNGPMPPTDGFAVAVEPFIPELATTAGKTTVKVDSVHAGAPEAGVPATYYLSASGAGGTQAFQIPLAISFTGTSDVVNTAQSSFVAAKPDASFASKFNLQNAILPGNVTVSSPDAYFLGVKVRAYVNGAGGSQPWQGPQWFVSGSTPAANPSIGVGYAYCGQCGAFGALTAGAIPGYDVHLLKAYGTVPSRLRSVEGILSTVYRAADVEVTWGANGAVTSVKDLSNHTDVPFGQGFGASYGFLNTASFANVTASAARDGNNNLITASDWYCVEPVITYAKAGYTGFADCAGSAKPAVLQNAAAISQIDSTYAGTPGASTAKGPGASARPGFAMYLSGELFFFFPANGQLPASGTKWTLRTYSGFISATAITDASGNVTGGKSYSWTSLTRPPNVPGLQAAIDITPTTAVTSVAAADLNKIHTVPDPYYVRSAFDLGPANKEMHFVNLPTQALIRIYTVNGTLVRMLEHNDPLNGGEEAWDLRNRTNQFVASGVYFYVVEAAGGLKKTGRFTVIQFAR